MDYLTRGDDGMNFVSEWITTKDFENLKATDVFHKQFVPKEIKASAFTNYHSHFIKELNVDKIGNYEMRISADDYYKLYINGEFVCQGPAQAYFDSYNYNQIDISDYLHRGKNTIAVHVYYQGLINRAWDSGDNRMGLIADILCGGEYVCGTDESWLCERAEEYSGDTTVLRTQFREDMDFDKKNPKWKTNAESGKYENAKYVKDADWRFKDAPVLTVETYKAKPESILKLDKTTYLMDFGGEITGCVYFKAKGERGQKIVVKYGEELEPDGRVRFIMRCECDYYDECTLSGREDEFEFFDYKAFRYVQVECDGDAFEPNGLCVMVRHHKFDEKCTMKSDIPNIEDIWGICRNALKYSVQEGYLDCPSREKAQYIGDFTVTGFAHLYLTGDAAMYKKALFDFAESTRVCKGILAVAPGSFMQEIAEFSLQYPLQVLNYYNLTKDKETLKELYPIIEGLISHFKQFERPDGLIENVYDKWNIVDWPQNLRDGYCVDVGTGGNPVKIHNVLNAYYIGAVQITEEIQNILGLTGCNNSDKLKAAFLNVFYDKGKKVFFDDAEHTHSALHSNVLPLFFDIAPNDAYENIKDFIMKKGLSCGVHFAYFVLKSLGKIGAYDEEFRLLMDESEHSWINMIREGATTCFEAWGKAQKWNTSLCHPWASAPIIIVIEDIMKISGDEFMNGGNFIKEITKNGQKYKIELCVGERHNNEVYMEENGGDEIYAIG